MLCLGSGAKNGKAIEHNWDVSGYVAIGRCICRDPSLALGGFNLQAEGRKSGDPERPYSVHKDGVTLKNNVVDIGKDCNELSGVRGVALWKLSQF